MYALSFKAMLLVFFEANKVSSSEAKLAHVAAASSPTL